MDTDIYNNDVDSVQQIEKIEFTVLGNDEILRISAFGENSNGVDVLDLYENSEPKKGSLNDPRMGTTSHDIRCVTCSLTTIDCPGHPGHITLAEYAFHIGYKDWVQKILSCICFNCSKLLIHKNEEEIKELIKTKSPKERLTFIKNATKNVSYCQKAYNGCGTQKPKIKIEIKKNYGAINMIAEMENNQDKESIEAANAAGEFVKTKSRLPLNAEVVYEIFKKISDDDCRILGFDPEKTRPEDLIHRVLLIPPIQMRPAARGDASGGISNEDDLTHKLSDIVRHNSRIIKNKENQTENSSKYHSDHLLQYHIATYMDNEGVVMLKSEQKGRAIKSVSSRIKGKYGRIRQNLMGKAY